MAHKRERLVGVALAGGQSKRMGRPKAELLFDGMPLIHHVIRALECACDDVVVVGGSKVEGVDWLPDRYPGEGPVGGLLTACLSDVHADLLFVTGCDTPRIRPELVLRLREKLDANDAAVPRVGGRLQPLCALYRRRTERMRLYFDRGGRSMTGLLAELGVVELGELELRNVDPGLCSFLNVNSPEDFEQLVHSEAKAE